MINNKDGSDQIKPELKIVAQPDVMKGVCSNLALIRHTAHEFVIDFIFRIGGEANLVSRVIVSPHHAMALKEALLNNIKKYERNFGKITEDKSSGIIFLDDFEDEFKWEVYGEGKVVRSSEIVHSGKSSLKKINRGDPHGGFRNLEKPTHLNILFSGWIYRPSESSTSLGDRLAIEDNNFNGYGFCINHNNNTAHIERRDKGRAKPISKRLNLPALMDQWYKFLFYMKKDGIFTLKLFNKKKDLILELESNIDKGFGFFNRVVVHGGYPYYIDDLKIEKII